MEEICYRAREEFFRVSGRRLDFQRRASFECGDYLWITAGAHQVNVGCLPNLFQRFLVKGNRRYKSNLQDSKNPIRQPKTTLSLFYGVKTSVNRILLFGQPLFLSRYTDRIACCRATRCASLLRFLPLRRSPFP